MRCLRYLLWVCWTSHKVLSLFGDSCHRVFGHLRILRLLCLYVAWWGHGPQFHEQSEKINIERVRKIELWPPLTRSGGCGESIRAIGGDRCQTAWRWRAARRPRMRSLWVVNPGSQLSKLSLHLLYSGPEDRKRGEKGHAYCILLVLLCT